MRFRQNLLGPQGGEGSHRGLVRCAPCSLFACLQISLRKGESWVTILVCFNNSVPLSSISFRLHAVIIREVHRPKNTSFCRPKLNRYLPKISPADGNRSSCWNFGSFSGIIDDGQSMQSACKLSEDFAKPYFHKYWTEIHDVTTIWKRNVCCFIVTLNAFDVRPSCDTADVQAILPFPPNPLKHVLCDIPDCGVDALSQFW